MMKFSKNNSGDYVSENGRWTLCKYIYGWCIWDNHKAQGAYPTLKQAKEFCEFRENLEASAS